MTPLEQLARLWTPVRHPEAQSVAMQYQAMHRRLKRICEPLIAKNELSPEGLLMVALCAHAMERESA